MDITLRVQELSRVPKDMTILRCDPNVFFNLQPRGGEHVVGPDSTVKGYDGLRDLALADSDVDSFTLL